MSGDAATTEPKVTDGTDRAVRALGLSGDAERLLRVHVDGRRDRIVAAWRALCRVDPEERKLVVELLRGGAQESLAIRKVEELVRAYAEDLGAAYAERERREPGFASTQNPPPAPETSKARKRRPARKESP